MSTSRSRGVNFRFSSPQYLAKVGKEASDHLFRRQSRCLLLTHVQRFVTSLLNLFPSAFSGAVMPVRFRAASYEVSDLLVVL